jgi:hypothetical protein
MKISKFEIEKEKILNAVNVILDKSKMFEDRVVIFEKYIEPTEILIPKNENLTEEEVFGWLRLGGNQYHSTIIWCNRFGELHSYNDMPSRIILSNDLDSLSLEWHKNGVPFRSNNKFNKFEFKSTYSFMGYGYKVEWVNKEGELHSFNDIPAKITEESVEWFWNGNNCRMQSNFNDLPCRINKLGHMKFQKRKNDVAESVNYPFSTKHYGKLALEGLYRYEKYVKWPIRQILTL